jgi:hypothetical protein
MIEIDVSLDGPSFSDLSCIRTVIKSYGELMMVAKHPDIPPMTNGSRKWQSFCHLPLEC